MLLNRLSANFKKIFVDLLSPVSLTVFILLALGEPTIAGQTWPEGLREAVHSYFQALQVKEYRTRDSTLEDPQGILSMNSFDRTSHRCHEVPGQVYRVYKIPTSFREEPNGTYVLRSRFDLFYRQAESIAEIFTRHWEQGSDGALQVRFEKGDGKWETVEKREVLE